MDTRTKRAWSGLVHYANGGATSREIGTTVAACMGWVTAIAPFGLFDWVGTSDLATKTEEYRPEIENLLRFLCSAPKSEARKSLRSGVMKFLFEHGQHIGGMDITEISYNEQIDRSLESLGFTSSERDEFRDWSNRIWESAKYPRRDGRVAGTDFLPFGIKVPTKEYRDLADPMCDFVMSEYQRYLNREISRRDKKSALVVPIFVCPRCNKLVMPKRTGRKKYCSACTDMARSERYRQDAPAGEGKDYQWLYRLNRMESVLRKVFLRKPKNSERLKEIKSRQKESSRCQNLLVEMRL